MKNNNWDSEIQNLPAIEIFNHATLEMYHGGTFPDPETFCGRCWQLIKNDKPGERLIDWEMYEEDIEEIIGVLKYAKADEKHPDFIYLKTKLTAIKCKKTAQLIEGRIYSELEIIMLGFVVNGNRLEIPKDIFIHNYNDVKAIMKNFEGKYSKNGFDFPYPAEKVLNRIRNQETTNLKKTFQFFGTPKKICEIMCQHAFDKYENKSLKVLEPSAGQGAISDAVLQWFYDEAINVRLDSLHLIEFMEENYSILQQKYSTPKSDFPVKIKMKNIDFLKYDKRIDYFDVVIANPPFSKGQDIEHFYKMYEVCAPTGTIVSIMSNGFLYNSQKKFVEFREWLGIEDRTWRNKIDLKQASGGGSKYQGFKVSPQGNDEQVFIQTFESCEFSESGTNVITVMVVLKKNGLSSFAPTKKVQNKSQGQQQLIF